MEYFSAFEDKSGIIIYLNFESNNENKAKYYLRFSDITNFKTKSFIQGCKTDYIWVEEIKCLKKIPLAFYISKDKEVCLDISRNLRKNKILEYPVDISGRNILNPTFVNINNIYKIIKEKHKLNPINSKFTINFESDLKYNNKVIIRRLINNTDINFKNDEYHKDDSEDEDSEEEEYDNNEDEDSEEEEYDNNEDEDTEDEEEEDSDDDEETKRPYRKRKNIIDDDEDNEPNQTYTKQQKIEHEIINVSDNEDEL